MARYSNHAIMNNDSEIYRPLLDEKELKFIKQFRLRTNLNLPDSFIKSQSYVVLTWNSTMKMSKLADVYLGDPNEWWIIAVINKKPTDFNWSIGEQVLIPSDLQVFKRFIEQQ
jgi:hypothetical protein